ncbi:ATP synthase subunit I [Alkanindiges sp. WGS2144]|uniref:ATP synthase subunit I n=1 Tax=Alkanindiges sp. WGS2144 TaxID=3366808 RepID=UPI003751AA02
MRQPTLLIDRRLARGLTRIQAIAVPVAAVLAYLVAGPVAAKSALLGALLCWLASAYFAWQAFRQGGAKASRQILGSMYKGVIGKFVIVAVGFIVIFKTVAPLNMLALLGGFLLVQAMAWIYPIWASRQG